MITYDKVLVGVVTENVKDLKMYYRLFKLMLKDKIVKDIEAKDSCLIETDKFLIRFVIKNPNRRSWRNHYILNLTQDVEFHECCVVPKTIIREYLKNDKKWVELFE
ncbi:hypothetical protein AXJ14_gp061 [Geobacillus virus E3]|uniref:hypothetical protein n=1 Tax=Geobacillus virus E3 TaxID=1572712 RepID=UPI0006719A21|nr:hypothetical protein AXJ14_gp061 [Geobacillus virus E3]AJA41380.1 hypothetical protein E3_061 [Geobacillus virus E3]